MRLLSIDFDYFFAIDPVRMDWGHSEVGVMAQMADVLWVSRAADYMRRGEMLPITDGHEAHIWDRVTLAPRAKVYVADSHFQIGCPRSRLLKRATAIVSLDAHHDAGYTEELTRWDCSNWALRAYLDTGVVTQVRYPSWRGLKGLEEGPPPTRHGRAVTRRLDDGAHLGRFDAVFLCRSGSWVPPWCDDDFAAVVESAPRPIVKLPTYPERRPFSFAEAKRQADAWRLMMEQARALEVTT